MAKKFAELDVAVPNFGWFCSQACGDAYGEEFGVAFQCNGDGKISYYG